MAIQMRRGALASYDDDKMLAGELAVTTDENTADQKVFVAFAPGESKRILTEDDIDSHAVQKIWTGTCSTGASTATKSITLDNAEGFSQTAGVTIAVYFSQGNSATTPMLSINNGTATGVVHYGTGTTSSQIKTTVPWYTWGAGIKFFTYSSSGKWIIPFSEPTQIAYLMDYKANLASPSFTGNPTAPTQGVGNNSTRIATTAFVRSAISNYVNGAVIGQTYTTCDTEASESAKVVSASDITELKKGGIIAVKFKYGISANKITLNVNNLGARNVYYKGYWTFPVGVVQENSIVYFMYGYGTSGNTLAVLGIDNPLPSPPSWR